MPTPPRSRWHQLSVARILALTAVIAILFATGIAIHRQAQSSGFYEALRYTKYFPPGLW